MFDTDNAVKGQAGIYRTPTARTLLFGSDIDGKPYMLFNDIANDKNFDLGKNRLYTTGSLMQQLELSKMMTRQILLQSSHQTQEIHLFIGAINGLAAIGDKKTAVNTILKRIRL